MSVLTFFEGEFRSESLATTDEGCVSSSSRTLFRLLLADTGAGGACGASTTTGVSNAGAGDVAATAVAGGGCTAGITAAWVEGPA